MSNTSNEFVQAYGKLILEAWKDDNHFFQLVSDPRTALANEGVALPADATIEVKIVDDETYRNGKISDWVEIWESGNETGVFQMTIAHKPAEFDPENYELNEEQLELVAAGVCCSCCCTG